MKRTIYYMILCLLMSLGEMMAQGISGKVMDGKEQPVDGVAVILHRIPNIMQQNQSCQEDMFMLSLHSQV